MEKFLVYLEQPEQESLEEVQYFQWSSSFNTFAWITKLDETIVIYKAFKQHWSNFVTIDYQVHHSIHYLNILKKDDFVWLTEDS